MMKIDIGGLKRDLEELGRIGRDENGGVTRPSFSTPDLEARAWLKARIEAVGLAYRVDGAGNIFGRLEGADTAGGAATGPGSGAAGADRGAPRPPKTVMAGSHIDTVINGGIFDGALGVLAALECLRVIKESGRRLARPLEVAAFTDEEGNLVGDFLGSRAAAETHSRVNASQQGRHQRQQDALDKYHRIYHHLQCPPKRAPVNHVHQDE